jgi:hypothetical protein
LHGRKIHFIRNNAMQQVGIRFSAPEGQDARPSDQEKAFLKENGFMWRGREGYWSKQLVSSDDKSEIAGIEAEKGPQAARMERGRRRADCDRQCEEVFVKLANQARERIGTLPPQEYAFSDQQHER